MQINKLISKYNFNRGSISRIKYIVIHYTGSLSTAKNNASYFAKGDRKASAHYFVGYEGEIWQSVEDANVAWHCGAKKYIHPDCRNANSIGIEMCTKTKGLTKTADENWYFEKATVDSTIELTKYLMNKYGIPAKNVVRHYDVTGKCCPAPYVHNTGKHTWNEFKNAIGGDTMPIIPKSDDLETDNAKRLWNYLVEKVNPFAAAGIMGNLYAESGLRSNNLQNGFEKKLGMNDETYTFSIDSGAYTEQQFEYDKAGYGLAQWTFHTRKKALYEYIKTAGVSISNFDYQVLFLWEELKSKKSLLDKLKNSTSVREASNYFLHEFERPADQSKAVEDKRAAYGETFYNLYYRKEETSANKENEKNDEFRVRVSIDNLNIRKGPGTSYEMTGKYTGKGVFTIVEIVNDWGKLKSGAGWISLKYTERI